MFSDKFLLAGSHAATRDNDIKQNTTATLMFTEYTKCTGEYEISRLISRVTWGLAHPVHNVATT